MNKQEIENKIQDMERELEELKEELKQKEFLPLPNKRWRGVTDDKYYYIGVEGAIRSCTEDAHVIDGLRYDFGNYFRTEEEARFEVERLKVIAELREYATSANDFDWKDSYNKKYMIVLESDEVKADYFCSCQTSDLYFKSKEQAEDAIRAIGRERLVKYYFRREDASD